MTMSYWFRDYVFLPLEFGSRGVRSVNVRASRNIVITMILCGLWHGPSWNFVAWGGLHGVALAAYQIYAAARPRHSSKEIRSALHLGTVGARVLTLSVVMVGWVFFGTSTLAMAVVYLWRMLTWAGDGVGLGSAFILPITALVFLVHLLVAKDRNLVEDLPSYSVSARVFTYGCLLLALTSLVPSDAVPFVYVRF